VTPTRPRVLISAYACAPFIGSELAVGWNWTQAAAIDHDVVVLTTSGGRKSIEATQVGRNPVFEYFDLPRWVSFITRRIPMGVQMYYRLWQRAAAGRAQELCLRYDIDLVHHVTWATATTPTVFTKIDRPLVWGPVGGVEIPPAGLWGSLGMTGALLEMLRVMRNLIAARSPSLRATARKAAVVLAATSEAGDYLASLGATRVRVEPAIAHDVPDGQRRASTSGKSLRLLFVGRLIPLKGTHLAIAATAAVVKQGHDVQLSIVGGGKDLKRLSRLVERLGIAANVSFKGQLTRDAVLREYHQHDVLIFPSLHDSGGFAVIEAMGAGLPVIALSVGGPARIVSPSTGVLVEPGSYGATVQGLAAAVRRLSDPKVRYRLGANAQKMIREHYSWAGKRDVIRQVYSEALAQGR
jgi:glycosyltransferase involved in cell wall biosynthesis